MNAVRSTMLGVLLAIPFVLMVGTMMVDEFRFHRERGLPLWERIGHPLDTLTVVLCYVFLLNAAPVKETLFVFTGLALFSLLFVAKDEPIHRRLCRRAEHLTHIVLFVLHPLVLGAAGLLWWFEPFGSRLILQAQVILTALFMIHQLVYWNLMTTQRGFGHGPGQTQHQ